MTTVTDSELAELTARGATERVDALLRQGRDANARGAGDETLLRIAARSGHAETAACLLAHGADPALPDARGQAALSPDSISLEILHGIRQHFHRYRVGGERRRSFSSAQVAEWAEGLDRTGIAKLPGLVGASVLAQLQRDFLRFVAGLNTRILRQEAVFRRYDEEEHWWPRDRAYVSNNAFRHSAALARLCGHPDLLDVVDDYLGQPAHITRAVAMRYLPDDEKDRDMFAWHHDMEDRRLKLFVLLTDVGPNDQYMSYVCGSHRLYHPYAMFLDNRCSLEYCREKLGRLEVFNTEGRAGDAFLFDSNGIHRGNRRPQGAVRDACFVEYSGDCSDIWGGDIPAGALDGLRFERGNPFKRFLATEKKWERPVTRKAPTWAENLPNIGVWAVLRQEE